MGCASTALCRYRATYCCVMSAASRVRCRGGRRTWRGGRPTSRGSSACRDAADAAVVL